MKAQPRILAVGLWTILPFLVPSAAHADPIRVISGSAGFPSLFGGLTVVAVSGDGLSLSGEGGGFQDSGPGEVGTSATLNARLNLFPIAGARPETVDGTVYDAVLAGDLIFNTESFVVEAPLSGNGTVTTFRVPFTMTGVVRGYVPAGVDGRQYGALLFEVSLFGTGFASQTKTFNNGSYRPARESISYTFQEAASPTPEPASLLLLGTGLAGLSFRHRRR